MARKRIQGITIVLDGETKALDKALQDVNKRSRDLQNELREVEKALKFNPGNVELLSQKQKILTEIIETTSQKLDRLRQAEQQVQEQFKKGEIGEQQYRAFQREIIKTESQLEGFKKQLASIDDTKATENLRKDFLKVKDAAKDAKEEIKNVGSELANMVAGAAAAGGVAGVIEKSLDISSLDTQIDISFNVPEKSKQSIKQAIRDIEAYGLDAQEALEGVRRQWALNSRESDKTNAKIVKGAAAIARAYNGIDFIELIQEINEIGRELKISDENALGLVNQLLKIGFPPEQLDIIAEYGQQLRRAGFNAQEIQAIFAAGIETGTWNIDNLLDGLKEGRIRLAEFGQGVPKATKELLANTNISAKQLQKWGQEVAKGGDSGRKAMQDVAKALMGVKDETTRNALGVAIFGTMWEDQGENITETILNMGDHLKSAKENQDLLNDSVNKLDSSPAVQFQQALGQLKLALEPLLGVIASIIGKIAEWAKNNPTLAATITAIVTTLGILLGIMMGLAPIFTALSVAAGALGVSIGAIATPVLVVIGVITALIAIGVALWKNWDTVRKKASEIWGSIKTFFSNTWNSIKSTASNVWNGIKNTALRVFGSIRDGIINAFNRVRDRISGIWSGIWGTIRRFINYIIDGINTMIRGLNKLKFKAPDWVPFIGGKSFGISIPTIPRLARGGVVSDPTLAVVGDSGPGNPEIVAPKKMLRQIIRDVMAETQNQTPIIIENMNVRDEADIKKIARELFNLQRAQKRGLGYR